MHLCTKTFSLFLTFALVKWQATVAISGSIKHQETGRWLQLLTEDRTVSPEIKATLLPPDWNDDAKVTIPELGEIQGVANLSLPLLPKTRKFYWFAGIPYADPESYTKGNRFKVKQANLYAKMIVYLCHNLPLILLFLTIE